MKINLNRIEDLYTIDRDTPLDVIVFLMKTTGKVIEKDKIEKKFDKIKKYLEEYEECIFLKEEYSKEELSKISCYVSDTEEPWNPNNLMNAFLDILEFNGNFHFPDVDKLTFGSKTSENFLNYDILMTYILCKKIDIYIDKNDTLESLKNKLLMLDTRPDRCISLLKNNIFKLNQIELYHTIRVLKLEEQESKDLDLTKVEDLSKNININYIINKSILSNEEAVIYAAKFFNYDITETKFPIEVLNSLIDKTTNTLEFEDNFIKKFKINPLFFKLDKFWKEKLQFLYTPKTLNSLKIYENIEDNEKIESRYRENNFYDGIVDFQKRSDDKNIISFGNLEILELEILKISDLIENFKENLNFGKYETNIEKLVNICRENKDSEYSSLHKIIRFIQRYCNIMDENVKKLKREKDNHKNTITEFFTKLLEISKLLKNKEKIDDLENMSIMNSTVTLLELVDKIQDQSLQGTIKNIPLIDYKSEKFCKPIENYYSKLYEDLKNFKNLKEKSSEYLKNKSKYYSFTSYYYMYVLFKKTLFDLEDI